MSATSMPPEVQIALGALFRISARPSQPGDEERFFRIRSIVLDARESVVADTRPCWAKQRLMGAQGDA